MKVLFVTGRLSENYGGGRAAISHYNAIKNFAAVDLYQIEKKSTLSSIWSVCQHIYPPCLRRDIANVKRMLNRKKYDLVFVDSAVFGHIVRAAKENGCRAAAFFHNCEVDYIRVRFGNKNTIKSLWYEKLVGQSERLTVDYADYKMVFTLRDKLRIEELYNTKIDAIIPIGMMDQYGGARHRVINGTERYCLLFGPCVTANEEGFSWFVKNVSPHLKCKTVVAGKGFEKYKDIWISEKVHVKGFVDDISEVYDGAICVAIPLLSGGGMKIKTAEALMFGKYIFGTEEAFVGYEFEADLVGGQCDSAEEFIDAINGFLDRNVESFNSYAREQYLDKYSMDAGIKEFRKLECFLNDCNHLCL